MNISLIAIQLIVLLMIGRIVRGGWRDGVVLAALIFGTLALAGAEVLGAFRWLSPVGAVVWWAVWIGISTIALVVVWRRWGGGVAKLFRLPVQDSDNGWQRILLLVFLCVPVLAALVMAVGYPPNNGDSLIYHLPRQIYWMQQRSADHFAAGFDQLTSMPPLTEMVGVQLYLLSGSDQWHNLVQWGAYAATVLVITKIAQVFGAGFRGQAMAGIFYATLPAAFHEASNTKNDVVLGLWLSIAFLEIARILAGGPASSGWGIRLGGSIGLAILTKGTALVFIIPLALLGVAAVWKLRVKILKAAAVAGAVTILLAAPHHARNLKMFGSLFGPSASFSNERMNVPRFMSVATRNLATQMALPWPMANGWIQSGVARLHGWMGVDLHDANTTYHGNTFQVASRVDDEDRSTAPLHYAVLLFSPLSLFLRPVGKPFTWWLVVLTPVIGLLVFSFILRWQVWHSRLLIPMIAECAPVAGWALGRMMGATGCVIAALVPLAAWTPATRSATRPLQALRSPSQWNEASRMDARFAVCPDLKGAARAFTEILSQMKVVNVGLLTGSAPVYPFMIETMRIGALRFESLQLTSPISQSDNESPDAIVVSNRYVDAEAARDALGRGGYFEALPTGAWSLYLREGERLPDIAPDILPQFYGFAKASGLGVEESAPGMNGARLGLWPGTELKFLSRGGGARVAIRARAIGLHQTIAVQLNGVELGKLELARRNGSANLSVEAEVPQGENSLELKYLLQVPDPANQRDLGAVLESVRIMEAH